MSPIPISSPKEKGILQVSKWAKTQVLLDEIEMQDLLEFLGSLFFVTVSEPIRPEEGIISPSLFLEKYRAYISLLKTGQIPLTEEFRRFFSSALSCTLDPFYAIKTSEEKVLIKPSFPVVQLQTHQFFYSSLDQKFHSMVLSEESITWGLQFSYPQLYQDPQTKQIRKVDLSFPNTSLFLKLMKWMRSATLPTPFLIGARRVNVPIRIGKKSLAWIKNHPQLQQKQLFVEANK